MYTFFEKVSISTGLNCLYVRYNDQPITSKKCKRLIVFTDKCLIINNYNYKFFKKASINQKIRFICILLKNDYTLNDYLKKVLKK